MQQVLVPDEASIEACVDNDRIFLWMQLPSEGKCTVLVIDDNPDMAHFYRRATEGTRYHIVHVARGQEAFATVEALAPDIARGFGGFFQALMKEGALSVREKELIALGIGVAVRCVPCIYLHVQKCLQAGATREQILEATGVAVMMQGGPSFTHVPEVIHALEQLDAGS